MNLALKRHLPRRTFLRGMGAAIALPLLDSMIPAFGAKSQAPCRAAFVYFPNGVQMDSWIPVTEGDIARLPDALPRVLTPLAEFRDHFSVLGSLTVDGQLPGFGGQRATAGRQGWRRRQRAACPSRPHR